MKNLTLFLAFILSATFQPTKAATMIIEVEDFEFDPAIFTVNAGDTIMWMWDNSAGQHTTTSTTIPNGATAWDEVISQNSQMFIYIPSIPGSYDYVCLYHESMGMVGHFTVNGSTGITENMPTAFSINALVNSSSELVINYGVPDAGNVSLSFYDILGNQLADIKTQPQAAGYYTEKKTVQNMQGGVYFVSLFANGNKITKKIFVQ